MAHAARVLLLIKATKNTIIAPGGGEPVGAGRHRLRWRGRWRTVEKSGVGSGLGGAQAWRRRRTIATATRAIYQGRRRCVCPSRLPHQRRAATDPRSDHRRYRSCSRDRGEWHTLEGRSRKVAEGNSRSRFGAKNYLVAARVPPITFWCPDSPWPGLLIWASIIPAILGLVVIGGLAALGKLNNASLLWAIAYLFLSVLVITGLYVFSGTVTNNKLNQIIRFCYFFTGIALLGSLLPFALPAPFSNTNLASKAPLGILQGCVEPTNADAEKTTQRRCYASMAAANGLRIGWRRERKAPGQINGGLVVPLYVVVLALFGGAISMTRRVPEYQRRAMDSQDVLTNAEARETGLSDHAGVHGAADCGHHLLHHSS